MLSSMSAMAYAPTMAPVPTVARAAAPQAMDLGGLKEQATKLNPVVGTRSGSKRRSRSEAPQLPRPSLHRSVGSLGRCGGQAHPTPALALTPPLALALPLMSQATTTRSA